MPIEPVGKGQKPEPTNFPKKVIKGLLKGFKVILIKPVKGAFAKIRSLFQKNVEKKQSDTESQVSLHGKVFKHTNEETLKKTDQIEKAKSERKLQLREGKKLPEPSKQTIDSRKVMTDNLNIIDAYNKAPSKKGFQEAMGALKLVKKQLDLILNCTLEDKSASYLKELEKNIIEVDTLVEGSLKEFSTLIEKKDHVTFEDEEEIVKKTLEEIQKNLHSLREVRGYINTKKIFFE